MNFKQITVCLDMYGCPNRCKHCWLGHTLFGGPEKTNFYTGRKNAYRDIVEAIEILLANKISPRIQFFVNKDNIDELPFFCIRVSVTGKMRSCMISG